MRIQDALNTSGALKLKTSVKVSKHFTMTGGLNLEDSPLDIPPGELIGVSNYEPSIIGGYRRIDGCERSDGHPSPSDTPYYAISFSTSGGFSPAAGTTVTESGSGATGTVAYIDTVNNVVVLVATVGTFVGGGSTLSAGAQAAISIGTPVYNQGNTQALSNSYYYQKWTYLQSLIGPVGGAACSGPVRGVWPYLNTVIAFRDNAAGTAGTMWQQTSTGWSQIALGIAVQYNAGIYNSGGNQMPEGSVLVGATSGATMTVLRVTTASGTWGTDAAGYFIVASITGTPVANELLKVAGVTYCTYLSNAAQTLPAGGYYKFRNWNFNLVQTPTTGYRLYGINGVGKGFEYDGTAGVFCFITTGMSPDVPTNLEAHANYLFFSFAGGSLQNSGYQLPLNWNPVFGADARLVGDDVTFMREDVSQTLVIGTRTQIWILSGLQEEQFQIQVWSANTGAVANTDQAPGQMIVGEDRGISLISATEQYGDFEADSLTDKILSQIVQQFATDTPVGALLTRKKNLYRLVFASGTVYNLAINASGSFVGWTVCNWPFTVSCAYSGFKKTGPTNQVEHAYFGASNGYVYEIDKGRSFDGANITHFIKSSYWFVDTPEIMKRIRGLHLDVKPEGSATINLSVDTDYGQRLPMSQNNTPLIGGGGFWDIAIWDQFIWDSPTYQPLIMRTEIEGYNVSFVLAGNSNNDSPFTVSGALYQYSQRVLNRNSLEA